jgi:hypothetical protein
MPASPTLTKQFQVGDQIRVNLHHGKIEDGVVRAVIQDDDGIKLQVDVVGLEQFLQEIFPLPSLHSCLLSGVKPH